MNKGSIRITGEIPDPPGRVMGPVILRGGLFDGERQKAPVSDVTLTITRRLRKHKEITGAIYADCGDRIFEEGEMIRIFELRRATSWTQGEARE